MKKVFVWMILAVFTPCLFAQNTVNVAAIAQAAKEGQAKQSARVAASEKQVLEVETDFYAGLSGSTGTATLRLRQAYMKLREKSVSAARKCAAELTKPVSIAQGKKTIKIVSYVNMESSNLWQTEQAKFDVFARTLEKDAQLSAANMPDVLPVDFKVALVSFRQYVSDSKELNSSWALQSMMPAMDAFNRYMKVNPKLGAAMAKEFQKPIPAGWGGTVVASQFIRDHACEVWSMQDQLEAFAATLARLAK